MATNGTLSAAASMESIEETLGHDDLENDGIELQDQKNLLKAKIDSLTAEMSKMKQALDSKDVKIDDLTSDIKKLQQRVTELESELKERDRRIESLQEKVSHMESLQEELRKLKEEFKDFHRDYDQLYISQAACYFEQAICSHVLPQVFENDNFATIRKLMNYLNGRKKLPFCIAKSESDIILCQAKQRWEIVCRGLNLPDEWKEMSGDWDLDDPDVPDIIRAIGYLKERRIPIAHPRQIKVDLAKEKVESDLIKASMKEWKYSLVKKFFDVLGANIRSTGISHKELILS